MTTGCEKYSNLAVIEGLYNNKVVVLVSIEMTWCNTELASFYDNFLHYLIIADFFSVVCALKYPKALLLRLESGFDGAVGGPPLPAI